MKTLIAAISLLFILCGCDNHIDGWKVAQAVDVCSDRGGVDFLENYGKKTIVCNDGAVFSLNRGRKTPKVFDEETVKLFESLTSPDNFGIRDVSECECPCEGRVFNYNSKLDTGDLSECEGYSLMWNGEDLVLTKPR